MRIITGSLKGRKIRLPKNVDTRPTTDRTKESLFNIIDVRKWIEGSSVLDLFAGSGNLSFEAISRGAGRAVMVEQDRLCIEAIEQNAQTFGVEDSILTVQADVLHYLQSPASPYDLVFADPPYNLAELPELPDLVIQQKWLKEDGWFILEHDARHDFADHPHCVFAKPYGRTVVTIFLSESVIGDENTEQ